MWLWVGKIAILSLLLIFLLHYLYFFFLQNLTTPRIKDLVDRPNEQYEDIISSMRRTKEPTPLPSAMKRPAQDSSRMKDELKNFLTKELSNKQTPAFDQSSNSLGFSNFRT